MGPDTTRSTREGSKGCVPSQSQAPRSRLHPRSPAFLEQLEADRDSARGLALGLFEKAKDLMSPEVVEQLRREFASWSAR